MIMKKNFGENYCNCLLFKKFCKFVVEKLLEFFVEKLLEFFVGKN
jgi:hypothetical protein